MKLIWIIEYAETKHFKVTVDGLERSKHAYDSDDTRLHALGIAEMNAKIFQTNTGYEIKYDLVK